MKLDFQNIDKLIETIFDKEYGDPHFAFDPSNPSDLMVLIAQYNGIFYVTTGQPVQCISMSELCKTVNRVESKDGAIEVFLDVYEQHQEYTQYIANYHSMVVTLFKEEQEELASEQIINISSVWMSKECASQFLHTAMGAFFK